jgi:hypothetical protein
VAEILVENRPEAKLVEQGTNDEDGPPVRSIEDLRLGGIHGGIACEEPAKPREDLDEEVLASKISDDALLDLTAVAIGFDDADIFVDGTAGRADSDGSRVHENHYHDVSQEIQGRIPG